MGAVVHTPGVVYGEPENERLMGQTRTALAAVQRVARGSEAPVPALVDLEGAVGALCAAEYVVRRHLELAQADGAESGAGLVMVLAQIQSLRAAISESQLRHRTMAISELHHSLQRLRSGLTWEGLLEAIPVELGRMGFSRALLSRLQGTSWSARSAFAHSDVPLADALVRVGNAFPGRVGREEPETEVVRRQAPILVRDAQSKPRIHRKLITLADTRDYAAAPIIVQGRVIGLLHVDRHSQLDVVDSHDRELLGLFAEGVGLTIERTQYHNRLAFLKRHYERRADELEELLSGYEGLDLDQPARPGQPEFADLAAGSAPYAYLSEGPLAELTRRELEVLWHISNGASNSEIAARLGVSTGTVKTHSKNLLRKLGAANRVDAAAKFHRLTRSDA